MRTQDIAQVSFWTLLAFVISFLSFVEPGHGPFEGLDR